MSGEGEMEDGLTTAFVKSRTRDYVHSLLRVQNRSFRSLINLSVQIRRKFDCSLWICD